MKISNDCRSEDHAPQAEGGPFHGDEKSASGVGAVATVDCHVLLGRDTFGGRKKLPISQYDQPLGEEAKRSSPETYPSC